ncbi:MAG TPA: DUF2802 domain-containing protein [Steroidobacteraceae bacterium]|nr:DUF2802 domain-containing protein [Steroidobacteraceae bacterium]
MPQLPYISLEVALIVGRAVFLVLGFILAAVAFTRWRRVAEGTAERFAEQNTALLAQLAKMEESLAEAHRKLDALGEQKDGESRRAVPGAAAAPSYQIAIRMARSGATRDELMASCGLTRQEAELVLRLHAPARGARLAAVS